jgi:GTP-binding protein
MTTERESSRVGAPGTPELRNVAIVAHVDHGKTTLVDSILRQTGSLGVRAVPVDRVMDSNDQERERGITIFAKQASVRWGHYKLNLVDTPGHADFGGEVERGLHVVDGVLLLVDAAEGPLPQTRYVLSKAIDRGLPMVLVINKVDRPDARTGEVLAEVEQLVLDLLDGRDDAHHIMDFPVISAIAREGRAVNGVGTPGEHDDLTPLFEAIVKTVPTPGGDPDAPLQAIVHNLDASDYLGRLAVGRVVQGTLRSSEIVALCQAKPAEGVVGGVVKKRPSSVLGVEGLQRVDVDAVAAGDLFVVAGFPEIEIGDTIADRDNPVALERLSVDEPVLAMTFGVNTAPTAGKGRFSTSRQLRDRLQKEILGNVSIRLRDTDSPDIIEVAGRGELQLAVLIETMRREGYELQVSRPEVITRTGADGKREEPAEELIIDVPDEYVGACTQAIAPRKGQMTDMRQGDAGRTILRFEAPSRGLLGLRSELLTSTRGTALVNQRHIGYVPWVGDLPGRNGGAMIADRMGATTAYAMDNLQSRGVFFVDPGEDVYEGMIIGQNARSEDMVVNVCRGKQITNIRTHAHDDQVRLPPKKDMTLEVAIEWIDADELVEVTPTHIRLRKKLLVESDRRRVAKRG